MRLAFELMEIVLVFLRQNLVDFVVNGSLSFSLTHLSLHRSLLFSKLLWIDKLDHIIDSENSDSCFSCELERFDLGHGWLEHTSLQVVAHFAVQQIEAREDQVTLLLVILVCLLSSVVEDSKLSDQVCSVFRSVHGKSFWDDQKSLRELSNGKLFTSRQSSGEIVKVD